MYYELKSVINTLIKYHESVYEINPRKAEDGLNEIIDVFDEYTEVIRMLIENNEEKIKREKVSRLNVKRNDLLF